MSLSLLEAMLALKTKRAGDTLDSLDIEALQGMINLWSGDNGLPHIKGMENLLIERFQKQGWMPPEESETLKRENQRLLDHLYDDLIRSAEIAAEIVGEDETDQDGISRFHTCKFIYKQLHVDPIPGLLSYLKSAHFRAENQGEGDTSYITDWADALDKLRIPFQPLESVDGEIK